MRYVIVVDDEDGDQEPERPWTASIYRDTDSGEMLQSEAGIGGSVVDAVDQLLVDHTLEELPGFTR
jgi:hypothetical protein